MRPHIMLASPIAMTSMGLAAVFFLGLPFCGAAAAEEKSSPAPQSLKQGDRVVFLGDSITQAGAGPGGYITTVRKAIERAHGDLGVEVIGAGISGNRVPDLEKRLDRDVLAKKPTVVVIYIGINDVWHQLSNRGTSKEDFEKGLRRIIGRIHDGGARAILCTASVIGERSDGGNRLDTMLDAYCDISRRVAADMKVQTVDLRREFIDHLKKENAGGKERGILTTDGVHLNAAGNQFVAGHMLAALGVAPHSKLLRHVVLFKFKDDSTPKQVQEIVDAFGALRKKIPTIVDFEYGTDVSVENKAAGFTHCFVVTFKDARGRETYLPHPAHKEFIKLVGPRLDKVLVVDYWVSK